MAPAAHVACVLLAPWSLTVAERASPGVPVAVLSQGRRVLELNDAARHAGVTLGTRELAALSRCPELHAEVINPPALHVAWRELLDTLYARYSPRVSGEPGVAFLHTSAARARELAAALHAPVGLASSLDVAHLAARRAQPGEVRAVNPEGEQMFLSLTPTAHLAVLGLTPAQLRQLHFLGIRGLADLQKWSAAQREAFLGIGTARPLARFLKGERTRVVPAYRPAEVLEASLAPDAPLHEPGEAHAALLDLLPDLLANLDNRTCAYLSVQAETVAGVLGDTRALKWPLDIAGLERAAFRALDGTGALPLGVERLTVQLSGFAPPARQVGLWPDVRELDAVRAVLERFPQGLVKVAWRDVHSYAADMQYAWVDWLSGAERHAPMTPQRALVPAWREGVPAPLFGAEA